MTSAEPHLRITAHRQLRLSALLGALVAEAERRRALRAGEPVAPARAATPDVTVEVTDDDGEARLPASAEPVWIPDPVVIDTHDGLTIGEILDATAQAGFGFVIALLALVAIPFVGLSTPFGLAIALVGMQMVLHRARPWLPARVRRKALSVHALLTISKWLSRATRWMTHLVKARLVGATRGHGVRVIGAAIVVQGLGLALPLPIPGSNLVFLAPILVYAIGLLEEDGVLVAIGHVATLVNIGLMIALWEVIVRVLAGVARWLGLL